jgi:hypothetical protein
LAFFIGKEDEMKKFLPLVFFLSFFVIGNLSAYEAIFFDDFSDGKSDGWWLSPKGNWAIIDESLRQIDQPSGEDWVMGLVENLEISDQTIETEVSTVGYGGVVFWYQDKLNFVSIVVYPFSSGLYLNEKLDGVSTIYQYGFRTRHNLWYDLRVEANSTTGQLDIFVDDSYIFTYNVTTPKRTGQSGVTFGNGGANFDDFKLTYQVCDADYNGDGNINFLDSFQKRKDLIEDALIKAKQEFNDWRDNCYLPSKNEQ